MTILRHEGYIAEIEPDEEDGLFFGEVINAPGVITFYGKDVAELKAEFAKSVAVYEDLCTRHGRGAGKTLSGRFVVRMAPQQHARVAAAASLAGKSMNAWVVEVLEHAAGALVEPPLPRTASSA